MLLAAPLLPAFLASAWRALTPSALSCDDTQNARQQDELANTNYTQETSFMLKLKGACCLPLACLLAGLCRVVLVVLPRQLTAFPRAQSPKCLLPRRPWLLLRCPLLAPSLPAAPSLPTAGLLVRAACLTQFGFDSR